MLATGNYASAGAARALARGTNPLRGLAEGVHEKLTYGDLLQSAGVTNPWVRLPVGLALDVALDPTTYLGAGVLTKAGKAAKQATMATRLAELSGEAARVAEAGQQVARAGHLGTNLAEQARLGQRAALELGGRSLLPARANEALLALADRAGSALGNTEAAQALRRTFMVAPELHGVDRDVFLARQAEIRAAQSLAQKRAAEQLAPVAGHVSRIAREHGLDARTMERALSDAVELAKPNATTTDLRAWMTEADRNVYDRLVGDIMARRNRGVPELATRGLRGRPALMDAEGTIVREAGGMKVGGRIEGMNPGVGTELGSHAPGFYDLRGHVGPLPDEALAELKPGLADRIRRMEARALDRATSEHLIRSVDGALAAFGAPAREALTPHVRDMVAQINAMNAANLAATRAADVPITELGDEAINYLRRVMRPEARDIIRKFGGGDEGGGLSRLITEAHGAQKERAFKGLTISQINDLAEAGKLSISGGRPIPGGLFEENPFVSTVMRAGEAAKAIESARLLKDWARVYGKPAAFAPKDWLAVPNKITGLGEDIAFPPEVAKSLRAHFERVVEPGYFLRQWDAVQNVWKKYTLGIFPVYHTRNEVGDVWNAVVLGGMDPSRIGDAARVLWKQGEPGKFGRGGGGQVVRLAGRSMTGEDVVALADRLGVTQGGIMGEIRDALQTIQHLPKNVWDAAGQKVNSNAALRIGETIGTARENTTRLGLFMDRLHKGDAPEAAALYVKQHLFDYNELTAAEKQVLRRFMPFYSFTRYNVPLQLGYLFRKPGAFGAIQKLRNEAAGDQTLGTGNDAPLPRFLREGVPVRMGANAEGNPQFARMEGWLPATDVNVAMDPGAALQRAVGLLSPFIQQPIESALNVDLFRSDLGSGDFQPQERFPGETETMLGVPMNKRFVRAPLENVRLLTELDKLNPFGVFGTALGGPLGAPRPHPDPDGLTRFASLLAGRVYAVDPETEAMRYANRQEREVSRIRSELRRAYARGDASNVAVLERRLAELAGPPMAGGQ